MRVPKPAPLSVICKKAGISKAWYKVLRKKRLVPGWRTAGSRGYGKGRIYQYDEADALRAIQLVKKEQAAGKSLDDIERRHAKRAPDVGEYFKEFSIDKLIRDQLNVKDRIARRVFHFAVMTAFEEKAFHDYTVQLVRDDLLLQVTFKDQWVEFVVSVVNCALQKALFGFGHH